MSTPYESPTDYARRIRDNSAVMLAEVTRTADGTPKGLNDTLASAVLVAQTNLAIAASIAELAAAVRTATL